jgi:hypothetical protein
VTNAHLVWTGKRYPDIEVNRSFAADEVHDVFYPGFTIALSQKFFGVVRDVIEQLGFYVEAHDEFLCELATVGFNRCELSESLVLYRQHETNLIGYHGAVLLNKVV